MVRKYDYLFLRMDMDAKPLVQIITI